MKLLGFVNLFLPLVKGLLGVLGGLGKGSAWQVSIIGSVGVAQSFRKLLDAGTLFAMKGFTISLETISLVVQTSQNNMMF